MCRLCRTDGYYFTAHRSYTSYSGNMKKIIRKFKYKKIYELKNILTEFLSDLYLRYFWDKHIDYVDTVPGEHTDLLAGCFSGKNGIPFMANIIRIRRSERQGRLGLTERKTNVRDCFKLRDFLSYNNKNILLKVISDDELSLFSEKQIVATTSRKILIKNNVFKKNYQYIVCIPQWLVMNTEINRFSEAKSRLNMSETDLRHEDHRFEWSREEFNVWAIRIADKFGYSVDFLPVGPEDAKVGAPTQMGVFTREN